MRFLTPYIDVTADHIDVTWDDGFYATARRDGALPWQSYDAYGLPAPPSPVRAAQLDDIASAHLIKFYVDDVA